MLRVLFTLFVALVFQNTYSQVALIKDHDGWANVRQQAAGKSPVTDTLLNGSVVFIMEDDLQKDWLSIDYHKDGKSRSGYVHKSRIVLLDSLTKFAVVTLTDSTLTLGKDSMQVYIKKGRYRSKGRKITYYTTPGQQPQVKYINGKQFWGTDGELPRTEYRSIRFQSGRQTMTFQKSAFEDVFEPNLHMTNAYLDKATKRIYLEAINSDGAGGYVLVWTLQNGKIMNREVFYGF